MLVLPAFAQFMDPRLETNPALARVYAHDPEAAGRILAELDRIVRRGPFREDGVSEPDDPAYRALLQENPFNRLGGSTRRPSCCSSARP